MEANNIREKVEAEIDVKIFSFTSLAELGIPLELDNYQRPYVWSEQKISQMLDDLSKFKIIKSAGDPRDYYFGTLLLHRNVNDASNQRIFVIDGQQRLTSLSILYALVHQEVVPSWIKFNFSSDSSVRNIQQAKNVIKIALAKSDFKQLSLSTLFSELIFTVITVESEDLAFTFFDTQNNRGVPLKATDLLKAYHLRAINSGNAQYDEVLQSHSAIRWESVQVAGERGKRSKANDFAPELFHYYLWRARNWRGTDVKELEDIDDLYDSFGSQSMKAPAVGHMKLYAGGSNLWAKNLQLLTNNEYRLELNPLYISQGAANLPLALRQPIQEGVGFFLYAEKYAALLNQIFHDVTSEPEIVALRAFYDSVIGKNLSVYLQSLFRLALLMYMDRLGVDGMYHFALWLDHRLGALRLGKSDIRRETPLKFLRDSKRNLIDVIAFAYHPAEVISFLQEVNVDKTYQDNNGWEEAIKEGRKVQSRYAKAVADHYGVSTLKDKIHLVKQFCEKPLVEQGGCHA